MGGITIASNFGLMEFLGIMQFEISDGEGNVAADIEVVEFVSKPAADEDPFAKLLESPELAKPARACSKSFAQPDNENQKLLLQLRRQLAAFEKNSRAAEHEDPDEVITGAQA